jgi:hypothetical protein
MQEGDANLLGGELVMTLLSGLLEFGLNNITLGPLFLALIIAF